MCRATASAVKKCVPGVCRDRIHVIGEGQLCKWRALHVKEPDGVERDIDAARVVRYSVGVFVDGLCVERINFPRLGNASCGADFLGHTVELGQRPPGKEDACSPHG